MKILNRFKNKNGASLIFVIWIVTLSIFFTALLVDIGLGYSNKIQIQNIADAAAIGGASAGKEGYSSIIDNKIFAVINKDKANPVAKSIIQKNSNYLMKGVSITGTDINRSGKVIDGKSMNWRDQYYSGNFTVTLSGNYKTMFIGKTLVDQKINIPFLNFLSESRVHVTPQVAP